MATTFPDPRAALAEAQEYSALPERQIEFLAERGVLLVTREGLTSAVHHSGMVLVDQVSGKPVDDAEAVLLRYLSKP